MYEFNSIMEDLPALLEELLLDEANEAFNTAFMTDSSIEEVLYV